METEVTIQEGLAIAKQEREEGTSVDGGDVAGWYSFEEKQKLIEELYAFEAGGGTLEAFADSKGLSKWSIMRYRKQVKKSEGRDTSHSVGSPMSKRSPAHKNEMEEKALKIKELFNGGMLAREACKQVGISYATYAYWIAKVSGKSTARSHNAPRVVRQVVVRDEDFNKSLRQRIIALEKIIIEQTLDIFALKERLGGAI